MIGVANVLFILPICWCHRWKSTCFPLHSLLSKRFHRQGYFQIFKGVFFIDYNDNYMLHIHLCYLWVSVRPTFTCLCFTFEWLNINVFWLNMLLQMLFSLVLTLIFREHVSIPICSYFSCYYDYKNYSYCYILYYVIPHAPYWATGIKLKWIEIWEF